MIRFVLVSIDPGHIRPLRCLGCSVIQSLNKQQLLLTVARKYYLDDLHPSFCDICEGKTPLGFNLHLVF